MHPAALPWRGRRVLVTGAGGLLGVPVARALVAAGAAVVAQVGARPHPDAGLPQLRATFPADAEALLADVRPDAVVHLAAPVDLAAPASALAAGITEATARLHAAAGRALFVNVGTCDEYGAQPGPLHEGLPPAPQSAYAALKAEAGAAVLARAAAQGTAALHLRPFRCLGPGDRSSVLAAAAAAQAAGAPLALSDGAQEREWNAAADVAAALVRLAAHPAAPGRVWNLGGGLVLSVRSLVEAWAAAAAAPPGLLRWGARPRRPGEPSRFVSDSRAAAAQVGPIGPAPLPALLAPYLPPAAAPPPGGRPA